jgi:hypothetical protein
VKFFGLNSQKACRVVFHVLHADDVTDVESGGGVLLVLRVNNWSGNYCEQSEKRDSSFDEHGGRIWMAPVGD